LKRVEDAGDIVGVLVHGIGWRRLGVAEPAKVDRNATTLADQRGDLRIPHCAIQRKCVQEDDRQARADVVERDLGVADERDHSMSGH
jgi:hypothetical protein